jgi:hypothetical protein
MVLLLPATINDPSVAPGFGMTLSRFRKSWFAFSNIAWRIGIGTVVIPLSDAVMGRVMVAVGHLLLTLIF